MRRIRIELTTPGWAILLSSLMLTFVGVVCILAGESDAIELHRSVATKQLFFMVAGLVGFVLTMKIGYQYIGRLSYALFAISLILLVPLIVARATGGLPLVPKINGTYRWIVPLPGLSLQPSELVKIAFVVALAWYLRHRENYSSIWKLTGPFAVTVVPMFLILLQPDLGTALLMMPVLFTLLIVAGARLKHLILIVLLAVGCLPVFWANMEDYQRSRIAGLLLQNESVREQLIEQPQRWTWLTSDPIRTAKRWEKDSGMQLIRSKGALGNGGLLGQGWGETTYVEHNLLIFMHNDCIFAVIGEQWGFVGCLVVLTCYLVIVVAGFQIALRTYDPFGRLLAVGAVSLIGAQVLINVSMNLGLAPITGMTLPFVSAGGSSLISTFLSMGLLVSVAQRRPFMLARRPFEQEEPQYVGVG